MPKIDPTSPTYSRPILPTPTGKTKDFFCDRCGARMEERQCKVACPNCGNRFDCSDLNLHFDELKSNQ